MKRLIFSLAALAVVLVAWLFRWDIATVSNGMERWGGAYMLDRWTGSVYVLHGANKVEVTQGK